MTDPYLSLDACVRFVETVSAGVVLLVVRRPEGTWVRVSGFGLPAAGGRLEFEVDEAN